MHKGETWPNRLYLPYHQNHQRAKIKLKKREKVWWRLKNKLPNQS